MKRLLSPGRLSFLDLRACGPGNSARTSEMRTDVAHYRHGFFAVELMPSFFADLSIDVGSRRVQAMVAVTHFAFIAVIFFHEWGKSA